MNDQPWTSPDAPPWGGQTAFSLDVPLKIEAQA